MNTCYVFQVKKPRSLQQDTASKRVLTHYVFWNIVFLTLHHYLVQFVCTNSISLFTDKDFTYSSVPNKRVFLINVLVSLFNKKYFIYSSVLNKLVTYKYFTLYARSGPNECVVGNFSENAINMLVLFLQTIYTFC